MIINRWTGIETRALREAMSLTLEKFASVVGVSDRTVRYWEAQGVDACMRSASLSRLNNMLAEAPADVIERFKHALAATDSGRPQPDLGLSPPVRVVSDPHGQLVPAAPGADEPDQVWVHARTAAGEVVLVSVPRRTVVTGVAVGALAAATGSRSAAALANTAHIDHVEHFRTLRLALIESDNLHGSAPVIPLMEQNIERIGQLRSAGIGDSRALLRMRILYAEFAAWLHQDCRNFNRAKHWTDRALTWSHQLHDSWSIAVTLIRKAQIANDQGDGGEAVELADAAAQAAPPGTRFAAVAAAFSGYGAALAGRRGDSDRAFDRARTLIDDADADPTWGFFLDHPYIDVHQAHARTALGDHCRATDQFGRAITAMRSGYTRDQAVYLSRQALAHARGGEPEPAAGLGLAAMRVGVSTGSQRILSNVRDLDGLLAPAGSVSEVAEFRDAARKWAVVS
ncbi:helix-turn-helix domain-containing protein [Nocardia carnea]|uniref:helix-turn-helix domain-containing protein n=1 Tax=Nocardia carnea TaxID=37328 RepID=UPI0024561217|nr:hypothetical protein [Nocardia carnea]